MDAFDLHKHVISDYAHYTKSFVRIGDDRVRDRVERELSQGLLWPDPLLQLNPSFEPGRSIDELVTQKILHKECRRIFRAKDHENDLGRAMRLHVHQDKAIEIARESQPYVLTTGTGSGKSLSYIIPIVNHVLNHGSGNGIQAIVVYPMNALANSQQEELNKFLRRGFGDEGPLVTYERYTGQENDEVRERIRQNPPDIILTNYVMLELMLTRIEERRLVSQASNLKFLVFDELHTYRGRQGADVAMLIRRCRESFNNNLLCVGTSATMSTEGTSEEQSSLVSKVASKIFGETVSPENIIGERLRSNTKDLDFQSDEIKAKLKQIVAGGVAPPDDYQSFSRDPLAAWIEQRFGIKIEQTTGQKVRQTPSPINGTKGAASELSECTGTDISKAEDAIRLYLEAGSQIRHPETGFPLFAFRLHQFISRGDTAWASLEPSSSREIFLRGQKYVPGDRSKLLYPLVFCRSCGQEYYRVNREENVSIGRREDFVQNKEEGIESGYLYLSTEDPWPTDDEEVIRRVPENWLEEHNGTQRVKRSQRENLPEVIQVSPDGRINDGGLGVAFLPAPFRFCLNPDCGVVHNSRQRSDVAKLATIGTDGRSTATSVLALSTILKIKSDPSLSDMPEAQKLLSFTDNRQDASLQAGHFNDFVEVSLVRSALLRAMTRIETGIRYDDLAPHVEAAMDLGLEFYANDPELRGAALNETRRALRSVLKYYLYRDLERGWRITSPNLEQCGLLNIDYLSLDELVGDQKFWEQPLKNSETKAEEHAHRALLEATPEQRETVIRVLLDHLRRSLAIKEDALSFDHQEKISDQSRQRLCDPWTIEDAHDMVQSGVAWPRSKRDTDERNINDIFLSPQSNFGLFLRHPNVLPITLTPDDARIVIEDLFKRLVPWGLVEIVRSPIQGSAVCGYQLPSSVMLWKAGDGSTPAIDRLRTTNVSSAADQTNQYFVQLYKSFAGRGIGIEAREHTAQVPAVIREDREKRFRGGELDILFCSPTMELGVDISQLNVVNMRNVPPTPANYAQRSGRAGRSGQAAFVYTYCSGFSPHDQYYFRRPQRMVAGSVTAPRVDLHNQDLIRSHVYAIWLTHSGLNLGKTLSDLLVVSEDDLKLPIQESVAEKLNDASIRGKALVSAQTLLDSIGDELHEAHWYRKSWLEDVLHQVPQAFDQACDRWRSLYKSAVQQRRIQNKIIGDHTRNPRDRDRAKRLRSQAEEQISLLTDSLSALESDFYSYRYFASEGFLPGYNFPRLPLSAFIPARRGRKGKNEFLSRPRFLAISEFGPRAVVYHEGARYRVNKVNLSFEEDTKELTEYTFKLCSECGYAHKTGPDIVADVCDNCGAELHPTDEISSMVRLQNVTVKRADQITSDEEERQRIGYEVQTTYQFSGVGGQTNVRKSEVVSKEGNLIAVMKYGDAAQIWRINKGWRRRLNPNDHGFFIDLERGYWETNKAAEDTDREDPLSKNIKKVVPYVEDHRNVLSLQFAHSYEPEVMATIQAALGQAIQQEYQLEPGELAGQPLPSTQDRKLIFYYESSEGGAGVLRQLVDDSSAVSRIAKAALTICHFDPETGADIAESQGVSCEAACYDCLLEYGNQMDHDLIDRSLVKELLLSLVDSQTKTSSDKISRADKHDELSRQCDTKLERKWLQLIYDTNRALPTHAQYKIEGCFTRPDFYYENKRLAIYVDGPVHDQEETEAKDSGVEERLFSAGIVSIRFHHEEDWEKKLAEFPDIFGKGGQ